MNPNLLVSIIIPTKNSDKTIQACITSCTQQTFTPIEIIIIDNYSTDETQHLATQAGARVIVAGNERSAQRNIGAQHAKGAYFLFIDSDMELSADVVSECIEKVQNNKNIQAIVIPEESFGTTFWAKCKQFERSCYSNTTWLHAPRFFRKDAFEKVEGFDEEMIGTEDFDIQSKIVKTFEQSVIDYTKQTIRHNEGALTLKNLLQKKLYYGTTLHVYNTKPENSASLRLQANPFARILLFLQDPKFILNHPLIFCATCLMKILEFGAFSLGYLLSRRV